MAGVTPRGKIALGCLGSLAILSTAVVWLIIWKGDTRRVPTEIALGELLQAQISALGSGWSLDPQGHLTSDSDMTHGLWVYEAEFSPYAAWLQFHTFRNPYLAERWFPPFPRLFGFDDNGNPPIEWDYVPPHADRFIIDCTPEVIPKNCYVFVRYQEYSLVYKTNVAGVMTLADLQHVLEVTDQFMANFLKKTRLERGNRPIPTLSELGL